MSKKNESKQVKKIYSVLDRIERYNDKSGQYGFYVVVDGSVKLLLRSFELDEGIEDFKELIKGKEKYIGCSVYVVQNGVFRKYVENPDNLIGGPVSLRIKEYKITKKYNLKYTMDLKMGALWYTNDDLYNGDFHVTDLKELIGKVHKDNIMIPAFGKIRAIDILENNI